MNGSTINRAGSIDEPAPGGPMPARPYLRPRAGGAACLCLLLAAAATGADGQVITRPVANDPVRIDSGLVRGNLDAAGVATYLGIPYAAAPVGALRWQEPTPVRPWAGVYGADRAMPECMQVMRAHSINHYFGEEARSEDCLYLNVWAPPGSTPRSALPVVVFIHGGGFTIGSSGMALYGGANVARSGAVFVNFNYRLGIFGFLAHPELTAESPHHASGNYGFLDQVAALAWIQRNIAQFGGDPRKVIVTGQSAGAASVALLQASPLAKGMFRGLVGMSGSAWGSAWADLPALAQAEQTGLDVAKALRAPGIAALRDLPADRLLALQQDCQLGCSGSIRIGAANVDGWFLPAHPKEIFAQHRQNDVPIVTGFNRDESPGELKSVRTLDDYNASVARRFGPLAARFLALYPASDDAGARDMAQAAVREAGMFAQGAHGWAVAQAQWGKEPAYVYMFAKLQPFNPAVTISDHPEQVGVYHTSDVPYWLQTQDALNLFRPTRTWLEADRSLARAMTASLVAFARTGNPTTAALPWLRFSLADQQLLEIGDSARARPMAGARFEFHAEHPLPPGAVLGARD
jgi:para-nitrobenzyl esterase